MIPMAPVTQSFLHLSRNPDSVHKKARNGSRRDRRRSLASDGAKGQERRDHHRGSRFRSRRCREDALQQAFRVVDGFVLGLGDWE